MSSKNRRTEHSQRFHDTATRLIADRRFGIPEWDVVTNPALEENAALHGPEAVAYPDIVARDDHGVIAIGEVETHETICDDSAAQWREFGELCPRLYLFVPEGTEEAVAELLDKHSICCAGLRTYSLDGDSEVEVESIRISNGHFAREDHPWWLSLGGGLTATQCAYRSRRIS